MFCSERAIMAVFNGRMETRGNYGLAFVSEQRAVEQCAPASLR
jgi:hypothetical protein